MGIDFIICNPNTLTLSQFTRFRNKQCAPLCLKRLPSLYPPVNNDIVRSYRIVTIVTNIVTMRTIKA